MNKTNNDYLFSFTLTKYSELHSPGTTFFYCLRKEGRLKKNELHSPGTTFFYCLWKDGRLKKKPVTNVRKQKKGGYECVHPKL